ncbi:MAG: DUF2933 domain-containing protein [Anaerolineaceae bacterium]
MSKKHSVIMILCCLIPIGAFLAIRLLNLQINSLFSFLLILLCPLSHVLMMGSMKHEDHTHHDSSENIIDVSPKE